jgi:prepilin-type N-terminal cleavage/methylation domain-containing protein
MKRLIADIKGVTLMELMVVLSIIAITAAIAAPSMSGWMARMKLNAEARKIYGVFQQARSEAIKNNSPVQVSIWWGPRSDVPAAISGTYCSYDVVKNPNLECMWGNVNYCITPPTKLPSGFDLVQAWTGGDRNSISRTTWEYTSRGTFTIEDIGSEGQTFALESDKLTYPFNRKVFTFTLGGSVAIK